MKKFYTILICPMLVFSSCYDKKTETTSTSPSTTRQETLYHSLEKFAEMEGAEKASRPDKDEQLEFMALHEIDPDDYAEDASALLDYEISLLTTDTVNIPGRSEPAVVSTRAINRCGTYDPEGRGARKAFSQSRMLVPKFLPTIYEIPLIFHVVWDDPNQDRLPNAKLESQMHILNQAFAKINIRFTVRAVKRYKLHKWDKAFFDHNNPALSKLAKDMCDSLATDMDEAINVYLNNVDLFGQANFPWSEATYRTNYDYVLLNYQSLPGYVYGGINTQGKTLIHELGHFFGLFHTFHYTGSYSQCNDSIHDGCQGVGDRIADTPPQKVCRFYSGICENGSGNECDQVGGKDMIAGGPCENGRPCDSCADGTDDDNNNYMGYNPDELLISFTPQQYDRMSLYFFAERLYYVKQSL